MAMDSLIIEIHTITIQKIMPTTPKTTVSIKIITFMTSKTEFKVQSLPQELIKNLPVSIRQNTWEVENSKIIIWIKKIKISNMELAIKKIMD